MTGPEMLGSFEVHRMPSGETVYYRDSNHAYHSEIVEKGGKWIGPRGTYLPSPSTIGKVLDLDPEGLIRWAAKQTCEGVVMLDGNYASADALWGALVREKLTYKDLKERRGVEGTNVHVRILRALAAGKRVPSLADVSAAERGYGQGVLAAWHDLNPEPVASEFVVYSPEHGFAGRPDLLCMIDHKLTVLDLKTGYVGKGTHGQVAGYDIGIRASGYGDPEKALILKVSDDGTYKLIPCAALDQDFLNALAGYRSASEIGKREREQAKEAVPA